MTRIRRLKFWQLIFKFYMYIDTVINIHK
jgi:hypothetical protein